jgi:hypothetical protein
MCLQGKGAAQQALDSYAGAQVDRAVRAEQSAHAAQLAAAFGQQAVLQAKLASAQHQQ